MFAVLTRQTATQDRQGTAAKTNKIDKARQGVRQGTTKSKEKQPKMEKIGGPGMGDILHK